MSFIKKMVKGAKNVLDGDSVDKGKTKASSQKKQCFQILKQIYNTLYGLGLWRYFSIECKHLI